MFGRELTARHHTDRYIRHAHTQTTYSHIPNKQLDEAKSREVVTALSTKDSPLRMVKR
jgi:hypothetical protein